MNERVRIAISNAVESIGGAARSAMDEGDYASAGHALAVREQILRTQLLDRPREPAGDGETAESECKPRKQRKPREARAAGQESQAAELVRRAGEAVEALVKKVADKQTMPMFGANGAAPAEPVECDQ